MGRERPPLEARLFECGEKIIMFCVESYEIIHIARGLAVRNAFYTAPTSCTQPMHAAGRSRSPEAARAGYPVWPGQVAPLSHCNLEIENPRCTFFLISCRSNFVVFV